jgi:hypothetical protein
MTHATDPAGTLAHVQDLLQADPDHTLTWADCGHPELDEPGATITGPCGPVPITGPPPRPGRRASTGGL